MAPQTWNDLVERRLPVAFSALAAHNLFVPWWRPQRGLSRVSVSRSRGIRLARGLMLPKVKAKNSTTAWRPQRDSSSWHLRKSEVGSGRLRRAQRSQSSRGTPWNQRKPLMIIGRSRSTHPNNQTNDDGDELVTRPSV